MASNEMDVDNDAPAEQVSKGKAKAKKDESGASGDVKRFEVKKVSRCEISCG